MDLQVDMILVLSILLFTTLLFISNVVRVDVVAVLVLAVLGVTNLLPPEQLFSGFSSEAVISLIAIMIISAGLENTGISMRVARWMLKIGKEHPKRVVLLIMSISGILASFMRSLGTVALFLPIISKITARTGIPKSYLLLPMAFCTILGGMLTMVGTGPLIVLNSVLKNTYQYVHFDSRGSLAPFQLFDVFPIGGMMLLGGMVYLLWIMGRMKGSEKTKKLSSGTTKAYFKKIYGKGGDIHELRIATDSALIGSTVRDIELKLPAGLSILAVMQGKEYHFPPLRKLIVKANAAIALMGDKELVSTFAKEQGLKLLPRLNLFSEILHPVRSGLCEVVIPPSSQFVGQEVRELHMRRNHMIHVLALSRGGTVYQGEQLNKLTLKSGDTLGMYSRWDALSDFQKHPDFFVLTTTFPREKTYPKKMPLALFFFFVSIVLVIFAGFPISVGLLLGAVGMIATGVLSIDQAYESVSWKTVFLLAGLLPLGLAMQTTGTTEWLASQILSENNQVPHIIIELGLAVFSTLLALIISNIGATVLLVPVALDFAIQIGADPRIFALTVAIGASNTFIIPTHQVNALIAGPGGYRLKDFFFIGGWMTIIFWILMLLGLQLFF